MPPYPASNWWLRQINVKIDTVDNSGVRDANGDCPVIKLLTIKTRIFNENWYKWLTSEYETKHRFKQLDWHKYTANKKVVLTLVFGQCNEAILTKYALGTIYEVNHKVGNLVNFFQQLRFICYQNNNSGLSYTLYKGVITTKLLLNFTNPRPDDLNGYTEELKIKYSAMKAIAREFPNGTEFLEYLLTK